MKQSYILMIPFFLLILVAGYLLGEKTDEPKIDSLPKGFCTSKTTSIPTKETSARRLQTSDSKLLREITELEKENTRLAAEIEALKKHHDHVGAISSHILDVKVFDENLHIDPEIAELLQLTSDEKVRIDKILQKTHEQIIQAIKNKVSVRNANSMNATLLILPFPEEAHIILQQLEESIQSAIGTGRFELFKDLALQQWHHSKFLNPFQELGVATKTITFSVDSENGTTLYTVKMEGSTGGESSSGPALPSEYQIFRTWLPPIFQNAFTMASPTPTSVSHGDGT